MISFQCDQVNALDGLGQTPLHRSAQQGNVQGCRLLLGYGVDLTIVSLQGYAAAQLAPANIQKMLRGKPTLGGFNTFLFLECFISDFFFRNFGPRNFPRNFFAQELSQELFYPGIFPGTTVNPLCIILIIY